MAARRNICAAAVAGNGLVLKILPDRRAIGSWLKKHRAGDCVVRTYTSRAAVNREFDRQMQVGLTDDDVIAALLWYGGVSRTRDFDQNGHIIPKGRAKQGPNRNPSVNDGFPFSGFTLE